MSVDADVHHRERNERRALQIVGVRFLCLAAYIAYESATDLWSKRAPEHSIPGILLACVSVVVMSLLSRAKRNVGLTEFCTYLSAVLLAGLVLNAFFGPMVGRPRGGVIAKEGVGGLQGKACKECCAK